MTRHPHASHHPERTSGRLVRDTRVAEARRRFGGVDWLATIAGLLAAVGTLVLLGGLVGAAGSVAYQLTGSDNGPSLGAVVAGLAVLLISFFTGGWVAGRVARYDGGRNGFLAAFWFLALAAALAGLGAWLGDRYDVLREVRLPQWFSGDDLGVAAVVSALVGAAVALAAGWFGGIVGARYHKRADSLVTAAGDEPLGAEGAPAVAGRGRADLTTSARAVSSRARRAR